MSKPFAIVTGASSGIGLELAHICAHEGFDLLVAADRPELQAAAERLRAHGANVTTVETDLATIEGVDRLWTACGPCGQRQQPRCPHSPTACPPPS